MKNSESRKYMELAIEIMRRSIPDTRHAGKTPPKVSAALVDSEYAAANQVDVRTARRHLSHIAELGLVNSIGAGPTIEYVIK